MESNFFRIVGSVLSLYFVCSIGRKGPWWHGDFELLGLFLGRSNITTVIVVIIGVLVPCVSSLLVVVVLFGGW